MFPLFSLSEDLVSGILSEWLGVIEYCKLDTAICNAIGRILFQEFTLSNKSSTGSNAIKTQDEDFALECFKWIVTKGIKVRHLNFTKKFVSYGNLMFPKFNFSFVEDIALNDCDYSADVLVDIVNKCPRLKQYPSSMKAVHRIMKINPKILRNIYHFSLPNQSAEEYPAFTSLDVATVKMILKYCLNIEVLNLGHKKCDYGAACEFTKNNSKLQKISWNGPFNNANNLTSCDFIHHITRNCLNLTVVKTMCKYKPQDFNFLVASLPNLTTLEMNVIITETFQHRMYDTNAVSVSYFKQMDKNSEDYMCTTNVTIKDWGSENVDFKIDFLHHIHNITSIKVTHLENKLIGAITQHCSSVRSLNLVCRDDKQCSTQVLTQMFSVCKNLTTLIIGAQVKLPQAIYFNHIKSVTNLTFYDNGHLKTAVIIRILKKNPQITHFDLIERDKLPNVPAHYPLAATVPTQFRNENAILQDEEASLVDCLEIYNAMKAAGRIVHMNCIANKIRALDE